MLSATPLPTLIQTVCSSLVILALFAAALLRQPLCHQPGPPLSVIEALFLALSALTANGLSIAEPASTLSPLGCQVVLVLTMVGGTSMMVMAAWIIEELLNDDADVTTDQVQRISRSRIAWRTTLLLFVLHLLGAALTFPMWREVEGVERVLLSQTLAVDAVYHAGFWFSYHSLEAYRYGWAMHAVVSPLILISVLGYPVLRRVACALRHRERLDGYARAAIGVTASIYVTGTLAIVSARIAPYFYQSLKLGIASNMPHAGPLTFSAVSATVADASLLTISAQNVGLTTISLEQLEPAAWLALILLMVLAGMTPLAFAAVVSHTCRTLRGKSSLISETAIRCATAVLLWFAMLIAVGLFMLCLFEPYPFRSLLTEVVAACTSTSLTLGVTAEVTAFSKVILMLLMIGGAYGTLLLASTIINRRNSR